MYSNRFIQVFCLGVLIMAGAGTTFSTEMSEIVPVSMNGWVCEDNGKYYDPSTLYEYINGGAEVYLAFNFKRLFTRHYLKDGEPDIIVDLFDMGNPDDAIGVYFNDLREGEHAGIAYYSEWMDGSLFFQKNKFFISIISFDKTDEAWQTVRDLAKIISDKIPEGPHVPDLVEYLPENQRNFAFRNYFHLWNSLNSYYYLADDNILDLDLRTRGILAHLQWIDSGFSANYTLLILIEYPSKESVLPAYTKFRNLYFPKPDKEGIGTYGDGKFGGVFKESNYLIILLYSDYHKVISDYSREIISNLKNKRSDN